MPPGMKGFVAFISVAFALVFLLSILRQLHVLDGRPWMIAFYSSGALAALASWITFKRAS